MEILIGALVTFFVISILVLTAFYLIAFILARLGLGALIKFIKRS